MQHDALEKALIASREAIRALEAFNDLTTTLVDAAVGDLTEDARNLYYGLMACGTPELDALCEAEELSRAGK